MKMRISVLLFLLVSSISVASDNPTQKHIYLWDGKPIGWKNSTMNWYYNDQLEPQVLQGQGQQIIQKAFNTWSSFCSIKFNYLGKTYQSSINDGMNIIEWGKTVPGTWGQAIPNHDGNFQFLTDADIKFNREYISSPDVLFRLALHEIGHAIGLYHSNVSNAVMSGPPLVNYTFLGELQADDVNGCQSIYKTSYPERTVLAKEYMRAETGQYFISTDDDEQYWLETGKIPGWIYTGNSFNVWFEKSELLRPVCRFYRFPDGHFFTADKFECLQVQSWHHDWLLESPIAFFVIPTVSGKCLNQTKTINRFFRPFGEPAHRFVSTEIDFLEMTERGWINEGPVFCSI